MTGGQEVYRLSVARRKSRSLGSASASCSGKGRAENRDSEAMGAIEMRRLGSAESAGKNRGRDSGASGGGSLRGSSVVSVSDPVTRLRSNPMYGKGGTGKGRGTDQGKSNGSRTATATPGRLKQKAESAREQGAYAKAHNKHLEQISVSSHRGSASMASAVIKDVVSAGVDALDDVCDDHTLEALCVLARQVLERRAAAAAARTEGGTRTGSRMVSHASSNIAELEIEMGEEDEWTIHVDARYGAKYWYNVRTGETSWRDVEHEKDGGEERKTGAINGGEEHRQASGSEGSTGSARLGLVGGTGGTATSMAPVVIADTATGGRPSAQRPGSVII